MMEDHLYYKDFHEPIIYKDNVEGKSDAQWELLNWKTVVMIRKYIDKTLFEHISTYTNAYELWTKLESMIQMKTPRNKANLVRQLVKLEYKDQKSWDTLVVTLSNSVPEEKLTMDTVSDSLLGEEARRIERGRSKSRSKITCYYCRRMGHKKMERRSFKRDQKADNVKPDQISPTKKQEENSITVIVSKEDLLYLVDEVSSHSYRSDDFGTVQMGSQDRSKIVGIGDIILTIRTRCKLILKTVRHVPAMRLNLISARKLDDVGLVNYLGEGKWKLTKGSLIMTRGKKEGSLYVIQDKLCKGEVNITTEDVEIWHKRLGHISEKGFHILARKQLLPNVKGKPLDPCGHCLAGK
ncbi:hypothetical protein F3Y22_tig00110959pilonHSYRG00025 [Hibiscus syriacus]|uniref:Uncharacterized protein n=1 Tax=Hibiscus syriacus TaxID=106335 RepID=A0A6A2ZAT0_HIBSY|nr:hypothetical protein F3Y22_tig00110959pilonHSYRG00025 [Hibiscus syriacus]